VAITQAICTSFRKEVLEGLHDFNVGANTFKLALYTSSATLSAATTVYSASNECTGTNYSAGGSALTNVNPTSSGTTAILDFANLTFSSLTLDTAARGALIYNSTNGNRAVCVLDFGSDKSSGGTDFTIVFPTADVSNAIIRIGD
jgi:hypothetical protein